MMLGWSKDLNFTKRAMKMAKEPDAGPPSTSGIISPQMLLMLRLRR